MRVGKRQRSVFPRKRYTSFMCCKRAFMRKFSRLRFLQRKPRLGFEFRRERQKIAHRNDRKFYRARVTPFSGEKKMQSRTENGIRHLLLYPLFYFPIDITPLSLATGLNPICNCKPKIDTSTICSKCVYFTKGCSC